MNKTKKVTKNKTNFVITVQIGKEIYKGTGVTALEALQTLKQPIKIFQKGIVTLSNGQVTTELVLLPVKLKRFWWKTAQPVLAKWFEKGLLGRS